VAEGEGEGDVLLFLVVSFFVVPALSFLVEDFSVVVDVFAGDFSGAVVVVEVSVLLVQAAISPAANMTVME